MAKLCGDSEVFEKLSKEASCRLIQSYLWAWIFQVHLFIVMVVNRSRVVVRADIFIVVMRYVVGLWAVG